MIEINGLADDMECRVSEAIEHITILQQYVNDELTRIENAIDNYDKTDAWQKEILKESRRPHLVTLSLLNTIISYIKEVHEDTKSILETTKKDSIQSDQTAE